MVLQVATHPLISHKITILRNKDVKPAEFRRVLKEITLFLGFEATRDLTTKVHTVQTTTDVAFEGTKVKESTALIPILRSGLGMADGMLEIIPNASVHHIGMYKTKCADMPVQYYNRLPRDRTCDVAYVVDPCIATSNTLNAVCSILKTWGAKRIVVVSVIATRAGIDRLMGQHPDVDLHVGCIDELDGGKIVPGIGDSGDRLFGTEDFDGEIEDKKRKA